MDTIVSGFDIHRRQEALDSGPAAINGIVLEKGYLSNAELDDILFPETMTCLGHLYQAWERILLSVLGCLNELVSLYWECWNVP